MIKQPNKVSKILIGFDCLIIFGLASWCVAFEPQWGLRKLRPTCRIATSARA